MEQERPTLPEHLSSPPVFTGVRVTQSLVLYVCCVDRCLSFFLWPLCCLFFFDIRILITSLWYLQTLLPHRYIFVMCYMRCWLSPLLYQNIFLGGLLQGRIQDLWLGGGGDVSRRGVWGPLKVPSWSRVEPW